MNFDTIDFALYLNIGFFSILGMGMLFGFLRGFRKSLISFLINLAFYAVFFLTLDLVIDFAWTFEIAPLGGWIAQILPGFPSAVNTLQGAVEAAGAVLLPTDFPVDLTNPQLMALVFGIAQFAVKIVYALLYFTIGYVLFGIVGLILKAIFAPKSKYAKKYGSENRGLGALFGLLQGTVGVFVMLITFSGLISVIDSMVSLLPDDILDQSQDVRFDFPRSDIYEASNSVIQDGFSLPIPDTSEIGSILGAVDRLLESYHTNLVVTTFSQLVITDPSDPDETMELTLYLFDDVLSFEYNDTGIAFRKELSIVAEVASVILATDVLDTGNLADLEGDDIRAVFATLSKSDLISSLIPLSIELAVDYFDQEIPLDTEELYAIPWKDEIERLGNVFAFVFDIANAAGALDGEIDLEAISIEGDDIRGLFDELAESNFILYATSVAITPLLEMVGEPVSLILTFDEDLDWAGEFQAIGAILGEILDTGVTYGDIASGDYLALLGMLSQIDFTVLLQSQLIKNAVINILSGAIEIPALALLTIPADIDWDTELQNILLAVNALASVAGQIDPENINLQTISLLDEAMIDAIFESRILVATITTQLLSLDFGDLPIVIPDDVFDEQGYLKKTELIAVANALKLAADTLICDPLTDDSCPAEGYDITKAVQLSDEDLDVLFESRVLAASIGRALITMSEGLVIVPGSAKESVLVRTQLDPVLTDTVDVVTKEEILLIFDALLLLDITDFTNIAFDASILDQLEDPENPNRVNPEVIDTVFASIILHATLSNFILDMVNTTDLIVVPRFAENGDPVVYEEEGLDFISVSEFEAVFNAFFSLDITDFENISFDFGLIIDNIDLLLESAILHATVSNQLLTLDIDLLVIPYFDENGDSIRTTVGEGEDAFTYIAKEELLNVVDALDLFGITDIESIGEEFDFAPIFAEGNLAIMLESAIIHATVSKQLIDLAGDMIVVPYFDENGNAIRLTVGVEAEEQTTYVIKDELVAVIDALDLFGITDIESIGDSFDFSPIFEEGNLAVMLESAIIHATVSKQLFDLAGDLIVVPHFDVDNQPIRLTVGVALAEQTTYVVKSELIAVIDALDLFGITDIEGIGDEFDFSPIFAEGNITQMLESAIIHATVTKQLVDLAGDLIVVPHFDVDGNALRVTVGVVLAEQTEYILKSELEYVIEALDLFGISDIDAIGDSFDFGPIFEEGNMALMLRSGIIHATVSKQIFDLSGDGLVSVPYFDEAEEAIRILVGDPLSSTDTEYIAKSELTAVIDALDLLGMSDIESFDGNFDMSIITEEGNLTILLQSAIIHSTVSDQIFDLTDDGFISVPYFDEAGVAIRVTVGDPLDNTDTTYLKKTELQAMIDALDVLGIDDINNFDGSIDLSLLAVEGNMDILLSSAIIHATVSQQIVDLSGDGFIEVPHFDESGAAIRVTVGDSLEGTDTLYLIKSELTAMIDALNVLGITDVETFDGSIDLSLLAVEGNMDILLSSAVIHATISKQILDLSGDGFINVPHFDEAGVSIRVTVGVVLDGTDTLYLKKTELTAMIDALNVLGITDVETFDGSIDLSLLAVEGNMDILLSSAIIHATISQQIFDLGGDGFIQIPYFDETGADLRIEVGDTLDSTDTLYLKKTELSAMIDALNVLGITDVESFSGSVDLSVLEEQANVDIVLSSSVIQATISKQIFDLQGTIEVPHFDEDGNPIRILVGDALDDTDTLYLKKTEISALIDAMNLLGIADVENFDGNIDLSVLSDEDKADRILASAVIQATISKQLLDLAADDTIEVPHWDVDDHEIRIAVGDSLDSTDTLYVAKTELKALFDSLDLLGITDVTTFDGNIDLTIFYTQENRNVLLASAVMHATISKQLLDLGDDVLKVPYQNAANEDIRLETGPLGFETEFVAKAEIDALFETLEMLGIEDVNTFDGDIDLTLFYTEANRNILLASASMHATISKQLLDLGDAVLKVPYQDVNGMAIRTTTGPLGFETEFVVASEIHALFETLEMLGITDVTTFDGDIDLNLFYEVENRNILLASASMHATISKQLLDLGDDVLKIPYQDVNGDDIRTTTGPLGLETEYVVGAEIHALFETLEMLGIVDVTTFDGDIDLTLFYTVENRDILLASAAMHATVSKQLLDLGDAVLKIPYQDVNGTPIRLLVGPDGHKTEFVLGSEIHALFETLEMLGITDVTTFDGDIDLTLFYTEANRDILLSSAAMHATVSKQLLDLGDDVLKIPYQDVDGVSIRLLVGPDGHKTEFVKDSEIHALFETLEMLGITDVTTFDGNIDLTLFYTVENRDILLASAAMHATVSKQLLDLGDAVLRVPHVDYADDAIRLSVGPDGLKTEFVVKTEIHALFETLEMLGITDITTFDGDIDLTLFYSEANRNILLASAAMHATVSKQLLDLGDAVLTVPYKSASNQTIRVTVGLVGFETEYVVPDEIHALFETLEMLGITDITTFDGAIDLTLFYTVENRNILLASASMHATVSRQLLDLGDAVLRVPSHDSLGVAVKLTVGDVGKTTDYVSATEIHAIFEALEILGIDDITTFDGNVDLSLFYNEANQDILLASASMHATISKQIRDLGDAVLLVPDQDVDANPILLTVSGTEYMTKVEIKAIFESLEVLGITDIGAFDGNVDLSLFYSETNQNILLASASMHATISKQMLDLGDAVLLVPAKDIDNFDIRLTVSGTEFIVKTEIKALIEVLELLGISDIGAFDGTVNLTNFYNTTNQNILLASASMHATVSKQIIDLDGSSLTVPFKDVTSQDVRLTVGVVEYLTKDEIKGLINALELLGVTDISTFDGSISLTNFYTDQNQTILLSSATMHATVSKQMLDLGDAVLRVPNQDVDAVTIRVTVGAVEYIVKAEIKALIEALEILGVTDITAFDGNVDLSTIYEEANQNVLLASASMHATISKQIIDLSATTLVLPNQTYEGVAIRLTVAGTDYVTKTEVKALIEALEVLGVTDIGSFDGSFDLNDLATEGDQNTLLASASMHATFSKTLLDLADDVLIVPEYAQNGTTLIKKIVALTTFITRGEIKAVINAFRAMGYTDLDSFGAGIDSSKFFDDIDTLLLSSSIQATLSDKLLTGTGGALIIPDQDILANQIRITVADSIDSVNIVYVEKAELKALMEALDLLGLNNFGAISITPAILFAADLNTLFESASMQATVSDKILDVASDESGAAGNLIVPDYFREALTAGGAGIEQIEKAELIALLDALEVLGITDFSATIDASVVTDLSGAQLDTLLISGSMHVTVSYMIQSNGNVSGSIPALAQTDAYDIDDILTKAETKAFILAANTLGASSIATVNFDLAAISALTPAERDTVLSSMIVRNMVTTDIENGVTAKNAANFPGGPFYTIDNTDYEESNPLLFLTKQGALDAIDFINS